ncbi:hypothetical protein [Clostridium sp. Marseille-Q7071]
MFGGLKNIAPKVPSSLPNSTISQGSKIPINKGTSYKLSASGDNVGNMLRGAADSELKLIGEYANNNVFGKSVSFNAGEEGTGITYKVFQRNNIEWYMMRTTGAKKGRNLTKAQAAERYGLAPILDEAGNVATLHHSQHIVLDHYLKRRQDIII